MGTIKLRVLEIQFFGLQVHPIQEVLHEMWMIVILIALYRVRRVVEMFVGQLAKMLG